MIGDIIMNTYNPDNYRFKTISDFKFCMMQGGEVQFDWNGKGYVAFGKINNPSTGECELFTGEGYYLEDNVMINITSNKPCEDTEGTFYKSIDEMLDHLIDGEKLRKIITQVTVTERTI